MGRKRCGVSPNCESTPYSPTPPGQDSVAQTRARTPGTARTQRSAVASSQERVGRERLSAEREHTSLVFILLLCPLFFHAPGRTPLPLHGGGSAVNGGQGGKGGRALPHRAEELRSQEALSLQRPFCPALSSRGPDAGAVPGSTRRGAARAPDFFPEDPRGKPRCPEIRQCSQGGELSKAATFVVRTLKMNPFSLFWGAGREQMIGRESLACLDFFIP